MTLRKRVLPPLTRPGKPHAPTDEARDMVTFACYAGIAPPRIAQMLGITETTMRKHYAAELTTGQDALQTQLMAQHIQICMRGDETARRALEFQIGRRDAINRMLETRADNAAATQAARAIAEQIRQWLGTDHGQVTPDAGDLAPRLIEGEILKRTSLNQLLGDDNADNRAIPLEETAHDDR
jgi:hypothetical protein